jgi:L-asparaginase/Glu-tRNA(Gln) amidotransferase subunit D
MSKNLGGSSPAKYDSNEILKCTAVKVFSTGGTIDSSPEYDPHKKSVFQGTNLPTMFAQARLTVEASVEPLMQKDSMDITSEDRQLMLDKCLQSQNAHTNNPRYRLDG